MRDEADRRHVLGWHLSKEISIGHLVMTSVLCIAIGMWGHQIDTRVTRVEIRTADQRWTDSRQESTAQTLNNALASRLDRMETKLDRLIETAKAPGGG